MFFILIILTKVRIHCCYDAEKSETEREWMLMFISMTGSKPPAPSEALKVDAA